MATAHTSKAPGPTDSGTPGTAGDPAEGAFPARVPPANGFFVAFDGHAPTLRDLLTGRGPRRWMAGAGISCIILVASNWRDFGAANGAAWAMLVIFVAVFVAGPPLSWNRPQWVKLVWAAGFFGLSLAFLAIQDASLGVTWLWAYVSVFIASQGHPRPLALTGVAALCMAAFALNMFQGSTSANAFAQSITIGSLGLMMLAFSRQVATIALLRQTQHELAALAVSEERNRVARDMHDILGHSLTVIAVKAELAGRLLPVDPGKAGAEIAELEDLARGALEDVRATVGGYRGASVLSELASARTALAAAGIEAELPGAADAVPATSRELFGWALREGVTNVIRHGNAKRCRVILTAGLLQVDDDGVGPCPPAAGQDVPGQDRPSRTFGNGLRGLSERAAAAGATMDVGRSDLGGFRLRIIL